MTRWTQSLRSSSTVSEPHKQVDVFARRHARIDADLTLHAPHLLDVEVTQVLRRLSRAGTISAKRSALALDTFGDLRITRYEHGPLLKRVWTLRDSLSAYDACYVALAEAIDARLVTFDEQLAGAKHRAVTVIPKR